MRQKLLMTASTWQHIMVFHLSYVREFQKRGWEVHLAAKGVPKSLPDVEKTIPLPFVKKLYDPRNFLSLIRLRKEIAREQYSMVITHTSLASFFTRMAVKRMKNRPVVVNVVHGYLFDDDSSFFKRQLLLGAERLTAPETDLLLTMNKWDNQEAKRYHLSPCIDEIPGMGVDFTKLDGAACEDGLQLRKRLGIPEDAFVLLYPAEFSRRKSQYLLIKAMRELPEDIFLVLCGSGETVEKIKRLARHWKLEKRILFPGYVENMPVWYRAADAAVTVSRSEGLPFNVMEAMHCNLPVIASAVKGHSDLIEHGETGLLYAYGEVNSLCRQIHRLRSDASLRRRLGEKAGQASMRYSSDLVVPLVMEKYLSAFDKREGSCSKTGREVRK